MRYFIELAYKGTNYHGWQIQPNAITVQETLEKALQTYLKEEVSITGSGRTDTGVHASFQVAHFDTVKEIDTSATIKSLNGILPPDISIYKIYSVNAEAHSRFDAFNRAYIYKISKVKSPFQKDEITVFTRTLDVKKMNDAAKLLLEHKDFECFSKVHTQVNHFLCDIRVAYWVETEHELHFHIEANRFLRGMVRAVVGTLLEIGQGKITEDDLKTILNSKDRKQAGAAAPAKGLYLCKVEYPASILDMRDER